MLEVQGLRRDAAISAADGDTARAASLLRRVLALDPSATSHLELGVALLDDGAVAEAVEHFNTALRLRGPYLVHRYLGEAYQALGRIADSQREQATFERLHREALRTRSAGR
jgi:tetratricopeptide (TPR) repeat protein